MGLKIKVKAPAKPRGLIMSLEPESARRAAGVRQLGPIKQSGVWDLYRDGVTNSLIRSFLSCRKQTELAYVDGWTNIYPKYALEFGTVVHEALRAAYSNGAKPIGEKGSLKLAQSYFAGRKLNSHPLTGEQISAGKEMENWREEITGLAGAMMPSYFRKWKEDFSPAIKWLHAESRFCVPFEVVPGVWIALQGMIDGVFKRKGRIYLLDTKTYSRAVDDDDSAAMLAFDFQLKLYSLVWMILTGVQPDGIVRNAIRKSALSRSGGTKAFVEATRADVAKRPQHYFQRFTHRFGPGDLRRWAEGVLRPVIFEIMRWVHGHSLTFVNADHLMWGFARCQMFNAIVHGDFSDYYQRKVPFAELEGEE
jgi:hypothetical protein